MALDLIFYDLVLYNTPLLIEIFFNSTFFSLFLFNPPGKLSNKQLKQSNFIRFEWKFIFFIILIYLEEHFVYFNFQNYICIFV